MTIIQEFHRSLCLMTKGTIGLLALGCLAACSTGNLYAGRQQAISSHRVAQALGKHLRSDENGTGGRLFIFAPSGVLLGKIDGATPEIAATTNPDLEPCSKARRGVAVFVYPQLTPAPASWYSCEQLISMRTERTAQHRLEEAMVKVLQVSLYVDRVNDLHEKELTAQNKALGELQAYVADRKGQDQKLAATMDELSRTVEQYQSEMRTRLQTLKTQVSDIK